MSRIAIPTLDDAPEASKPILDAVQQAARRRAEHVPPDRAAAPPRCRASRATRAR